MHKVVSQYKGSSSKRAFTLVELLVVISIISILLMILVPAISTALARGKKTKCLSNMRSWAIAITGYCSDHDGTFPKEGMGQGDSGDRDLSLQGNQQYVSGTGLNLDKKDAWFNVLPRYIGTESLWELQEKLGRPPRPGEGRTPFHCPSFRMRDIQNPPSEFEAVFSYGYNLWLDHPTVARRAEGGAEHLHTLPRLMNLMYVDNPSMLVVFGEVAVSGFDNMAARNMFYRHKRGKTCNIAFADGHARTYGKKMVFVPPGGNKAANRTVVWDPENPLDEI